MRVLVTLVVLAACSGKAGTPAPAPSGGTGGSGTGGSAPARDAAAGMGGADAASARTDVAPDVAVLGAEAGNPAGSLCAAAGLAVCEGFEETAAGALPPGWGRRSYGNYGGKSMAVASNESFRGSKALEIEGGVAGSQFLEWKGALGPLASSHWGRIFFKVKTPAPWPATNVLHGDIIQHVGPRASGGQLGVRWGIVENPQMKFQWIFNVQPSQAQEWGDGTGYDYAWPGTWQCLEWRYDQPAQQGMLWIDGKAIPIQVGKSHPPEIPVFTSLGVGWSNYQNAPGEGFVVWIDEVAFDGNRIGCER